MHKSVIGALASVLVALVAVPGASAAPRASSAAASQDAWDHVAASALRAPTPARPLVAPERFAAFTLDQAALADVLEDAPAERRRTATPAAGEGLTIAIPAPDGGFERFAILDSPIMAPGLAARHPEIKTYTGRGLDDPTASVRLDLSPLGFHASVRSDGGQWFVDPRYRDRDEYVAYERDAIGEDPYAGFEETDPDRAGAPAPAPDAGRDDRAGEANGGLVTLRVYRLALLSDPTYGANTPGTTTAAKVVLMNRVNQLYEQDFAFRMDLVSGNDALNLDTTAQATGTNGPCGAAACFTSSQLSTCSSATLDRVNVVAGRIVGAGGYDVAHLVLGVDGGGIAGLRVVGTSSKGRGCTGLPTPVGDYFAVDYVAHELGHQFGGDHSFNGTTNASSNCGPANRASSQAPRVEPGSGSSVMAYAGICGTDDLQEHSDPYFSQASITQISAYVTSSETTQFPAQQAGLNGYSSGSFAITYNGGTSTTISTLNASTIKNAIEGISTWPAGATATVSSLSSAGFTVTFGGTLAAGTPAALGFANVSGFAGGVFGVTAVAGTTHHGGTPDATAPVNHAPNVALTGAGSYTIPARTPFLLDATGSDAENDPLTYMWEENDPGGSTAIPLTSNTKTNGPLFRVFGTAARYADPVNDPYTTPSPGENAASSQTWRSFPDPRQVADGNTNAATGTCPTAGSAPVADGIVDCYSEFLPTADWVGVDSTRTMHFRVTARDSHPGIGGIGVADVALTVANGTGPFRVTSQASATGPVDGGTSLPVTWAVNGTAASPVNATNVKISLSLDGGLTFPRVLAASTPNDGSESVTLPQVTTTQARIRVEAVGNVFYDVSRGNLTIGATVPVAIQGPASADLGSAVVGGQGAATVVTFTNGGTGAATVGTAALTGADAAAVAKTADSCSGGALASGASCAITLRLAPTHGGAQAATLTLPSDDPASPATVALTGNGQTAALLTAPASADLGSVAVGATGASTGVTFTNTGATAATTGVATLGGADAAAVAKVSDGCSSRLLAAGASCTVAVRLAPARAGAHAATLTLPSDAPGSAPSVALTGTGVETATPPADTGRPPATTTPPATTPAPTPPATTPAAPTTTELVAGLLGVDAPYAVGSAGKLKLYTATRSTKLGKPRAAKAIAAAACTGGTCKGKATAKLTLTPRRGKAKSTTITLAKALTLRSGQASRLTLRLTAKQRKAIKAARRARLVLTVANGTAKVTRTFTLTVG